MGEVGRTLEKKDLIFGPAGRLGALKEEYDLLELSVLELDANSEVLECPEMSSMGDDESVVKYPGIIDKCGIEIGGRREEGEVELVLDKEPRRKGREGEVFVVVMVDRLDEEEEDMEEEEILEVERWGRLVKLGRT